MRSTQRRKHEASPDGIRLRRHVDPVANDISGAGVEADSESKPGLEAVASRRPGPSIKQLKAKTATSRTGDTAGSAAMSE